MPVMRLTVTLPERTHITTEHFVLDELHAAAKTILTWHDSAAASIDYTGEGQQ